SGPCSLTRAPRLSAAAHMRAHPHPRPVAHQPTRAPAPRLPRRPYLRAHPSPRPVRGRSLARPVAIPSHPLPSPLVPPDPRPTTLGGFLSPASVPPALLAYLAH